MLRIAAIVVTYNRLNLLKQCLSALTAQTRAVNSIIVVNNCSSDGTDLFLKEWQETQDQELSKIVVHMNRNTGGAGGFNRGIREAVAHDHDWIWVMDDDVVPDPSALQELLRASKLTNGENGFYSSLAVNESGIHTVNVPTIDIKPEYQGYPGWPQFLPHAIVKTSAATFVSLMISKSSVLRVGLPIKEFFIWGDDTEYTRRLTGGGIQGFLVGRSRVIHLRPGQGLDIKKERNTSRIPLYRFLYRNWIYISRTTSLRSLMQYISKSIIDIISLTLKHRDPAKAIIVTRGLIAGLVFTPKIERLERESVPGPDDPERL